MRVTIDKAGRVVIPKALRDRWRLDSGTELEVVETAEGVELQVVDDRPRAVLVEEQGVLVIDVPGAGDATEMLDETLALRDALRDRGLT